MNGLGYPIVDDLSIVDYTIDLVGQTAVPFYKITVNNNTGSILSASTDGKAVNVSYSCPSTVTCTIELPFRRCNRENNLASATNQQIYFVTATCAQELNENDMVFLLQNGIVVHRATIIMESEVDDELKEDKVDDAKDESRMNDKERASLDTKSFDEGLSSFVNLFVCGAFIVLTTTLNIWMNCKYHFSFTITLLCYIVFICCSLILNVLLVALSGHWGFAFLNLLFLFINNYYAAKLVNFWREQKFKNISSRLAALNEFQILKEYESENKIDSQSREEHEFIRQRDIREKVNQKKEAKKKQLEELGKLSPTKKAYTLDDVLSGKAKIADL